MKEILRGKSPSKDVKWQVERNDPYHFFLANQLKANTKIYSLTYYYTTANRYNWHILAGRIMNKIKKDLWWICFDVVFHFSQKNQCKFDIYRFLTVQFEHLHRNMKCGVQNYGFYQISWIELEHSRTLISLCLIPSFSLLRRTQAPIDNVNYSFQNWHIMACWGP